VSRQLDALTHFFYTPLPEREYADEDEGGGSSLKSLATVSALHLEDIAPTVGTSGNTNVLAPEQVASVPSHLISSHLISLCVNYCCR
jgi:hypothetical protein